MSKVERRPGPATVLVVEDQAITRMDLATELIGRGFTVIEAQDGEEGLRRLDEDPSIDAAILDINLPGTVNGYDLARQIRQVRPASLVVIISGQDFVMPADFDEHVIVESKPLDLAKIGIVLSMRYADDI